MTKANIVVLARAFLGRLRICGRKGFGGCLCCGREGSTNCRCLVGIILSSTFSVVEREYDSVFLNLCMGSVICVKGMESANVYNSRRPSSHMNRMTS